MLASEFCSVLALEQGVKVWRTSAKGGLKLLHYGCATYGFLVSVVCPPPKLVYRSRPFITVLDQFECWDET